MWMALIAGCGGGGGDPDAQEIARRVQDTIVQTGMVYHAVENDGTELWINAADQKYRKKESPKSSGRVSVGQGWIQTNYDPFTNTIGTKDLSPKGSATPRI